MTFPYIIAEAGSSHDGDLIKALALVDLAADLRASAVKFQYWSDPRRVAERLHSDALDIYRRYQIPTEWLRGLAHHAMRRHLDFLCTVDLSEDIAVVDPFVRRFKIASWGATDARFIEQHRQYGKPLIISTGVCTPHELIALHATVGPEDWLLHCVSGYPTPLNQANLGVIRHYGLTGFSDHTGCVSTGALAVAAGARVLEVHMRLEETDPENPDAPHSLRPLDLSHYISEANIAAAALGDGLKRVMHCEELNMRYRYTP